MKVFRRPAISNICVEAIEGRHTASLPPVARCQYNDNGDQGKRAAVKKGVVWDGDIYLKRENTAPSSPTNDSIAWEGHCFHPSLRNYQKLPFRNLYDTKIGNGWIRLPRRSQAAAGSFGPELRRFVGARPAFGPLGRRRPLYPIPALRVKRAPCWGEGLSWGPCIVSFQNLIDRYR